MVLNDKQLAARVIRTINENKDKLASGQSVNVDDSKLSVKMVTTIEDAQCPGNKILQK